MSENLKNGEIIPTIDHYRSQFISYSKHAFEKLPEITDPLILDVGCGSGIITIKLAEWTDGEIIGLEIDKKALNTFRKRIQKHNLSHRIKAIETSFIENSCKEKSFDIIWAEGVFHIIGYEKCLKVCHRILISKGFLVIADTLERLTNNMKIFENTGFKVYDRFTWKQNAWWKEYYKPLDAKLKELKQKGIDRC